MRLVAISVFVLIFFSIATQAAEYRMQRLGLLDGYTKSQALAINDSGLIVGTATDPSGVWVAVKWDNDGQMSLLEPLCTGGTFGVSDINSSGMIVGHAQDAASQMNSAMWNSDGSLVGATKPSTASGCWGRSINDNGDIAEHYYQDQASVARVRNADGSFTELLSLHTHAKSFPCELNNNGQVVGFGIDPYNNRRAVSWDRDGNVTALPLLDSNWSNYSEAQGINDYGMIAGAIRDSSDRFHAVVWDADGSIMDLTPSTAIRADAFAINDMGQVSGIILEPIDPTSNEPFSYTVTHVLWEADGSMERLSTHTGTTWGGAFGINNKGVVVGSITDDGCTSIDGLYAVVWTPVPEPSSIAALVTSLMGLGVFSSRRRIK